MIYLAPQDPRTPQQLLVTLCLNLGRVDRRREWAFRTLFSPVGALICHVPPHASTLWREYTSQVISGWSALGNLSRRGALADCGGRSEISEHFSPSPYIYLERGPALKPLPSSWFSTSPGKHPQTPSTAKVGTQRPSFLALLNPPRCSPSSSSPPSAPSPRPPSRPRPPWTPSRSSRPAPSPPTRRAATSRPAPTRATPAPARRPAARHTATAARPATFASPRPAASRSSPTRRARATRPRRASTSPSTARAGARASASSGTGALLTARFRLAARLRESPPFAPPWRGRLTDGGDIGGTAAPRPTTATSTRGVRPGSGPARGRRRRRGILSMSRSTCSGGTKPTAGALVMVENLVYT